MRKSKIERRSQFLDVIGQIQKVATELYGSVVYDSSMAVVDENDLSLRRLEELQNHLQSLQQEKVHLTLFAVDPFILYLKLKFILLIIYSNLSTCRVIA